MQPKFPRINQAIKYTLDFYSIETIKNYLLRFAGDNAYSSSPKFLDEMHELILDMHSYMEDEISQHIFTSNENTLVHLFNFLESWLNDDRIRSTNVDMIINAAEIYNERTYKAFVEKTEVSVKLFQSSPNYNRGHLETYEESIYSTPTFFANASIYPRKFTKTNYKYYCIEDKPELLDVNFIPKYLPYLDKMVTNFRSIVTKYVTNYKQGKIAPNSQIFIEKSDVQLNSSSSNQLPDSSNNPIQKLKWKGTPLEFAETFVPLINERKIILKSEQKSDTYPIVKLLHSFFEIQKEKGQGEITAQSLQTYFKNNNANRGSKSSSKLKK